MWQKLKKTTGWFLMIIGVGLFLLPLIFWIKSPELSQMQIFLNYWWASFGGIALVFIGGILAEVYT